MKRRTFLQRLLAAPVALPIAAKAAALPAAAPAFTCIPMVGELRGPVVLTSKDDDRGYREFILGLKTSGPITTAVIWDAEDATHTERDPLFDDRDAPGKPAVLVPFAKLPPI